MKFKRIILVCIFLLAILTVGAVSAIDDNATDLHQEITESADDSVELECEANDNSNENMLEASDEDLLNSNPNDLNVDFPEKFECKGKDDFLEFSITLPKNSKGIVSIYDNDDLIEKFNLSDGKISALSGKCTVFYQDDANKDVLKVKYGLLGHKVDATTFAVKFDDGINTIEKSALVDITYQISCDTELLWGESGRLSIYSPYDFYGNIIVEIDGKRYKADSDIFHDDDNDILHYFVLLKNRLDIGKHKVVIITSGYSQYPAKTFKYNLVVKANIAVEEWNLKNRENIELQLPKNAKGSLVLLFYNSKNKIVKKYSKKLKNGKVSFKIPKSFYGKFKKVVIKYSGKDYKVKKVVFRNIVINPAVKVPKKMLQGDKKFVSISLPGKKGILKIYVDQEINGKYKTKVYSKKLVKGKAKIPLSKLKARYDSIKIKFIDTTGGKKVSYTMYKTCDILKPFSFLPLHIDEGNDLVEIHAYKTGAKDLKGKYISVKINNKFFKKVKTDKYGIAKLSMPLKYKSKTVKLTAQYKKNIVSEKIKF